MLSRDIVLTSGILTKAAWTMPNDHVDLNKELAIATKPSHSDDEREWILGRPHACSRTLQTRCEGATISVHGERFVMFEP